MKNLYSSIAFVCGLVGLTQGFSQQATSEGINILWDSFASGYTRPCDMHSIGDNRLFVVEQTGRIKILYTDGTQNPTPFLNISDRVDSNGGEKGLLGLAFPPNYAETGYFFVNYTRTESGVLYTQISRFSRDPENPDLGLPDSELPLLDYVQDFGNHNGGQLEFGPQDGYLYIASGDGGSGGDPNNRAQNVNSYLGKILRIDINTEPYVVPDDNPFVGAFGLDEIWSYGLRNPWKFAFDSDNGDLYIADVGQSNREEVNFEAAGTAGGTNYGWRCFEGTLPFNTQNCQGPSSYQAPVFDYPYGDGPNGFRCSVNRGEIFTNLVGKYIFADYCSSEYWVMWQDEGVWNVINKGGFTTGAVAFAEDNQGGLYVIRGGNGTIYKLTEQCSLLEAAITVDNTYELSTSVEGAESYTWYLNGTELTSGQANIVATQNGNYTVVVETTGGCTLTSAGIDIIGLSVSDHPGIKDFTIYPNPAQNMVSVRTNLSQSFNEMMVSILAADGRQLSQVVINSSEEEIDLQRFAAGMYFIMLTSDGIPLAQRRLIKQ
jgi:hypothetical protein